MSASQSGRFTGVLLALTLLCAAPAPAPAHHSGAMFDATKPVTIKGVVRTFEWVNPHTRILLVIDPGSAEAGRTWMVEATSPGRLTREGWNKRSLKPGDHIEVKLAPAHSGEPIGSMLEVRNLATGAVLGRDN
jgi:hypothetical protein